MTEPVGAPQPNSDEAVRARELLVWMRPRLSAIAVLIISSFSALAIASQFDDQPIPKFLSQVFGLLWVLGFVQTTNLTIVHFFTRGVLRWIVLATWFSIQALGVYIVLTMLMTELGTGGSTGADEQGTALAHIGALIGELIYWLATYRFVRRPAATPERYTATSVDETA